MIINIKYTTCVRSIPNEPLKPPLLPSAQQQAPPNQPDLTASKQHPALNPVPAPNPLPLQLQECP